MENKIRKSKYTFNINFFKKIDNNIKSYYLGLLYADGYIGNTKSRGKELQLSLIDLELIESFKKDIESTHNIQKCKIKSHTHSQLYKICIINDDIFHDLINLGCFERKSLILKFPTKEQVNETFIPSFIRGYFDGDGHIYDKNYSKCHLGIAGTMDFLLEIKIFFAKQGLMSYIKKSNNIHILTINGINNLKWFYNTIYSDNSDLYLKRKHDKFINLFNIQNNKLNSVIPKKCIIDGCENKHCAKGFCSIHYYTHVIKPLKKTK